MRAASPALIAFLASRAPFYSADLFTLTLLSGTVLTFTSSDQSIVSGGVVYSAVGPSLTRSNWSVTNTTDVPEMTVKVYSTGSDLSIGNLKLLAHNGLLDGSTMTLQRAIMPTYGDTSLGLVTLFSGNMSTVKVTALGLELTVRGANLALQQYMPRNQFQTNCIHTLYDSGCTLSRSAYQESRTIAVSNDTVTVQLDEFVASPSYYVNGTILVTSGPALGQYRTIQAVQASPPQLSVVYPFYEVPGAGSTCTITQGCAKTLAVCGSQFSNTQHFRGFPFIPPATTGL